MQAIFDREFRREKQLEVSKRLGDKSKPTDQSKKDKNKDKIAAQLEAKLEDITVKFFEQFPDIDEEAYRKE